MKKQLGLATGLSNEEKQQVQLNLHRYLRWKPVQIRQHNIYVSELGDIITFTGRYIDNTELKTNNHGYKVFSMLLVARIELYAFGKLSSLKYDYATDEEVDYINNDKNDLRLENLQVLTHKQNIKKRDIMHGTHSRKISVYDLAGNYIESFDSIKKCSEAYGIASSNICFVLKGKLYSYSGKKFRYCDDKGSNAVYKTERNKRGRKIIQKNI